MDAEDPNALLLFRVGPVCCCAPSRPVAGVVPPPPLHRPPGSDALHPGVFRHGGYLVKVVDLGHGFGAPADGPGRIIVTGLPTGYFGFRVDDIIDVVPWPEAGWGNLPPPLPRKWFRRTLQHEGRICLYTEFERLAGIEGGGILRECLHVFEAVPEEPAVAPAPPAEPQRTHSPRSPAPRTAATAIPGRSPARAATPERSESSPGQPESGHTPAPSPTARPRPVLQKPPKPDRPAASSRPAAPRAKTPDPPLRRPAPAAPSRPVISAARKPEPPPRAVPITRVPPGEPPAPRNPAGAWLLILVLVATLATGLWYVLTDWLMPGPPRLPAPAPVLSASLPGPVAIPESPLPEKAPTENPFPAEPPPADEPEPPPAVEPTLPAEPASTATKAPEPAYRAEIRDDARGVTIVLHEPRPAPPEPPTDPSTAAGETPAPAETNTPSAIPAPEPAPVIRREIVHIVVRGDTLWDIAARYVHDPFRYPELARLSHIRNPDRIYPGDRVRILVVRDR